jgi:hypothetical protein
LYNLVEGDYGFAAPDRDRRVQGSGKTQHKDIGPNCRQFRVWDLVDRARREVKAKRPEGLTPQDME